MFFPIFEKISQNVPRFRYCVLNADSYKNVAISSLTTTTPIKMVPYLVAYNEGKAVAVYSGPKKYNDVLDFLAENFSKSLERPKFNRKSPVVARQNSGSTAHSGSKEDMIAYKTDLGVPYNIVCNSGQCYLSYDQIYEGGSSDSVPDSCYLQFDECYGQECKQEDLIQHSRQNQTSGMTFGASPKESRTK